MLHTDHLARRIKLDAYYKDFNKWLCSKYAQGSSSFELAERIFRETSQIITARQISRIVKSGGLSRTKEEGFKLALSKGRVHYPVPSNRIAKNVIPSALSFSLLAAANFTCEKCPTTSGLSIFALPQGLTVLCRQCSYK